MSRSFDLLLLGLVGGLGWWLFAREERPLDATRPVPAPEVPAPWAVDDFAILAHPSAQGTATVEDPFDGRTVQLPPR